MKETINEFDRILERFKFKESVPADVNDYILTVRKEVITNTLKDVRDYSFIFGIILTIFYFVKKLGISFTIIQSIAAAWIVSIISAAVIVTGTAVSVKYITDDTAEIKEEKIIKESTINLNKSEPVEIKEKSNNRERPHPPLKNRLGISSFTSENIDSNIGREVTKRIFSDLQKIRGRDLVVPLKNKRSKKVDFLLIGSVDKLGDQYLISAKIIDVWKGNAKFVTTEKVTSRDKIHEACTKLAKKIAEKM